MEISPGPFCCWLSCITYGLLDRLGRTSNNVLSNHRPSG